MTPWPNFWGSNLKNISYQLLLKWLSTTPYMTMNYSSSGYQLPSRDYQLPLTWLSTTPYVTNPLNCAIFHVVYNILLISKRVCIFWIPVGICRKRRVCSYSNYNPFSVKKISCVNRYIYTRETNIENTTALARSNKKYIAR